MNRPWKRKRVADERIDELVDSALPPEDAKLLWHRAKELLGLGFTFDQIEELPLRQPDIAHTADDLLKRGAPHAYVVRELKED